MAEHSVFGTNPPPGTQVLGDDLDTQGPVRVGNAFHVPIGTTGIYHKGPRIYVADDPTILEALDGQAVSFWLVLGQDLDLETNPALAAAELTIDGPGWQGVDWPEPVLMTPNAGYYVVYRTATGIYLVHASPQPGEIVSANGPLRMSPLAGDWNRSLFLYDNAGETLTGNTGPLWAVDSVVTDTLAATIPLTVDVGADRSLVTGASAALSATASGGAGAKSYAWTVTSGPSTATSQFSSTTAATPTFTPSAVGTYVLRCTVTDASGSANDSVTVTVAAAAAATGTVATVNAAEGWTATGGTIQTALSDANAGTYVTSAENPTDAVLDVTLQPLAPPAAGKGAEITLEGLRYTGTASSATASMALYNGTTLRATSTTKMIPSAATDAVFAFTADQVSSVDWANVRCVVTVSAAA